jgi:hypothetical protein
MPSIAPTRTHRIPRHWSYSPLRCDREAP